MSALEQIKKIIVEKANPDKIILFGSRARGVHREDSDYDILIVKNDISQDKHLVGFIYKEFYNRKLGVPVDLLLIDTDKYNKLSNETGYVYKKIKQEGEIIYEAV